MGKYGDILDEFYDERTRIVNALAQPDNQHILMRLIGALAFRTHCPKYGYIQDKLGRVFTDFDFVSYPRFFRVSAGYSRSWGTRKISKSHNCSVTAAWSFMTLPLAAISTCSITFWISATRFL